MPPNTAQVSGLPIAAICALLLSAGSAEAERRDLLLEVQPGTARPGDVVLITLHCERAPVGGTLADKDLSFFRTSRGFQAIVGIPVEQPAGELNARVQLANASGKEDGGEIAFTLQLIEPGFPSRELQVANRYVNPPPKAKQWMAQDRLAFHKAYDQPLSAFLFHASFAWPRSPLVTSHFGDLRLLNGKKQSQHFGTDLDGRIGDPVSAANDGVVVLARSCYASGNTVVIHHGGRLFTAYFHLSKMQVTAGKRIKRGEQIGLVGKTGRVTGPHLHWAAKVDDLYVNAESLLKLKFN
jgi:murein DD-endopeptidase MepM/ murein hydrolase activator NlpD